MKQKLFSMFALLLVAATGAWATDYTTLAVGDVIKVGDTFSPTTDGAFNDFGVESGKTYTLMRADIDDEYNVTEKTDGAYYVFKYVSMMSPYIHFEKAFAVTAISDGLEVTKIEDVKGMLMYTLALHESAAPAATTYSVTLADGTEDAANWTIEPTEAAEGATVTATYNGEKKVKSVTAVKKVATTPATITVTINKSDWGWDSFTKDGVTVSAGSIDPINGNLMGGGSFSTTLGNFTKIVVTAKDCNVSGTGWSVSGNYSSTTWAGTPASTVSFSGNINGHGETQTTIVCTIVPTN